MADIKGTAQTAYLVEVQMKAAAAYLEEAKKAVRIAMDTIHNSEEGDYLGQKIDEVIVLQRMLSMGLYDANRIVEHWTETRTTRENH